MIWNTVNVLTISCAGKIAGKLAWKILNELGVCWVGIGSVLCPFPCDVFVMYWPRTPPLAPSVKTYPRIEDAYWETIVKLWRLSRLEDDADMEIWQDHFLAWLVSSLSVFELRVTDFRFG